jgi:hypothetical protein
VSAIRNPSTPECLAEHTIEEIADKDVPAGKAYKIVDVADVPSDRTFRSAWEVDEATLTDGVGADSNEFPAEVLDDNS